METLPCPNCGAHNLEAARICYFCKTDLPASNAASGSPPGKAAVGDLSAGKEHPVRRPGCLTVYAVWMILNATLWILIALLLPTMHWRDPALLITGFSNAELERFRPYFGYYLLYLYGQAIVQLVIGWGLLALRNWARKLVMIYLGLTLVLDFCLVLTRIMETGANLLVCGITATALVIPGIIFFWFFFNRRHFH